MGVEDKVQGVDIEAGNGDDAVQKAAAAVQEDAGKGNNPPDIESEFEEESTGMTTTIVVLVVGILIGLIGGIALVKYAPFQWCVNNRALTKIVESADTNGEGDDAAMLTARKWLQDHDNLARKIAKYLYNDGRTPSPADTSEANGLREQLERLQREYERKTEEASNSWRNGKRCGIQEVKKKMKTIHICRYNWTMPLGHARVGEHSYEPKHVYCIGDSTFRLKDDEMENEMKLAFKLEANGQPSREPLAMDPNERMVRLLTESRMIMDLIEACPKIRMRNTRSM